MSAVAMIAATWSAVQRIGLAAADGPLLGG